MSGLGRMVPSDWEHVEKFPIRRLIERDVPIGRLPCVIGVNWYSNFDAPELDEHGRYWVGRGDLGSIRGGHCICVKSGNLPDSFSWRIFYNQGREGACVGFGISRMMSLINRRRYDAKWLWDMAKATDEWWDTNPGDDNGTSVRAGLEVLRVRGPVPWKKEYANRDWQARADEPPSEIDGILEYRWATTIDEIRAVLQSRLNDQLGGVPLLNSWGLDYPHIVWMPYSSLDRLIREDGEIGLITDRVLP